MTQINLSTATIRCIIGITQSIILYGLYRATQDTLWPATQPLIFLPLLITALFVPLLMVQSAGSLRFKTAVKWGFVATIILLSISCYAVYRQILPNTTISTSTLLYPPPELICLTTIALFIAEALVLSSAHDHRFIANYATYFDHSWKLGIQLILTIIFTACFWILLWLGSYLFEIIQIDSFRKIITQSWFAIPATTLAITLALHITDTNVRIIKGIRTVSLTLLSFLLPLITIIVVTFLVSLFFKGLEPLWKTNHAAALLIHSALILIILINTVYQDGSFEKKLSLIQRCTITLACYSLIPLTLLAIYALKLRVQQYGWSVQRIYTAAGMLIIASYALGYTLAAMMQKKNFKFIEYWNLGTAILMLAVYLALLSPLADPARLMVANQLSRLQSGQITPQKFDFAALHRQGLRFGQQALLDLRDKWQGADADYVHQKAKDNLLRP